MTGTVPSPDATFSVVMPLYNKRAFVRPTLESVLAQELSPREVIIVDDGSTDGSTDVIADLLGPGVRVVQQANAGPGPARNHGATLASGPWIALIDADDRWHPRHLANLAGVIAAFPDVHVVSAASRWQPAGAVNLALPAAAGAPRLLDYLKEVDTRLVHTSSIAIRRDAWFAAGGFGAFLPGEDVEFWTRLALDHRFAASPLPTSIYVRENDGIMDNDRRQFDSEWRVEATPFERLISRALGDSRYCERWLDIAAFSDRAVLRAARNMLYAGNGRGVRRALQQLRNNSGKAPRLYAAASYLPPPVLWRLAHVYSAIKRMTSHD